MDPEPGLQGLSRVQEVKFPNQVNNWYDLVGLQTRHILIQRLTCWQGCRSSLSEMQWHSPLGGRQQGARRKRSVQRWNTAATESSYEAVARVAVKNSCQRLSLFKGVVLASFRSPTVLEVLARVASQRVACPPMEKGGREIIHSGLAGLGRRRRGCARGPRVCRRQLILFFPLADCGRGWRD
jgi:hypothetical protein